MLIWLVKWRQTIGLILLVSLLWGSGGQEQPEGLERLSGWWVATKQGSGYGAWSSEWVQRGVAVPLWLRQGWVWGEMGGWLGVLVGVGWLGWGQTPECS